MIDIIIVGAGPAGMTAALYARRSNKTVLVLESTTVGGQIASSPKVENYPSVKSISGVDFADNLLNQILDMGAQLEFESVLKIEKEKNYFKVRTLKNEYLSKSVILAVGVSHKNINIPRENEFLGKGISYCAVCDGPFYQDETVALVGNGNTALQYSVLLSNYCKKLYVCNLFDYFCGDIELENVLKTKKNVEIINNIELKEFLGDGELTGLVFKNTQTQEKLQLDVKGVFIAIGQVPNNKVFENLVALTCDGYIISDENCKTQTQGVFVAGDCRTKNVRQLTTAVADGSTAALNACEYINKTFK